MTQEEVAANRSGGEAHSGIMQMVAGGAPEEQIRTARVSFTTAPEAVESSGRARFPGQTPPTTGSKAPALRIGSV